MAGAHAAAHAAHEEKKKQQEEEEEMTHYTRKELEDDFEFKIVRSTTGKFKKYEVIEQLKEEEALSGWIMVEKFDDNRIRFKRPLSAQQRDAMLPPGFDPYRTRYGASEGKMALTVLGVLALLGGIIGVLVNIFN